MFSGRFWTSYVVRLLTWSRWTHSGIIWRDPPGFPLGIYLLGSDGTLNDIGVQLVSFPEYVRDYRGKVIVYPIQGTEASRFTEFEAIYQQTQDAGYSLYPPDIIRALQGGCTRRARQEKYFLCSAYVAYVYEKVGLISPEDDWTLIQPKHLVGVSDKIHWQNCSFGSPIAIK